MSEPVVSIMCETCDLLFYNMRSFVVHCQRKHNWTYAEMPSPAKESNEQASTPLTDFSDDWLQYNIRVDQRWLDNHLNIERRESVIRHMHAMEFELERRRPV